MDYRQMPSAFLAGRNHRPREMQDKVGNPLVEPLLHLDQFSVNRVTLASTLRISAADSDSCIAYTCLSGAFTVEELAVKAGETVLVPAECSSFTLTPVEKGTVLLEVLVEPRSEPGF